MALAGTSRKVNHVGIDEIAHRYVDEWAPLDPVGATYVGIPGHDHQLTDLSPDGFAAEGTAIDGSHLPVHFLRPTRRRAPAVDHRLRAL